jgi:hypothetical protein
MHDDSNTQRKCEGCKASAPVMPSDYTLIGRAWRVIRHRSPTGAVELLWYCPRCWERQKGTRAAR